ncbi:fructuronate reductase [Pseudobutyrivibrio sp. YE44]|uniref:mannitol dehydrogenase family protein n=1 Tax=Pseudobutyrivibrio sp. YE44 TaxID=1520802 RepID=UPI000887BD30|nr:mannitol dehydrogenase family protein [Pseudobutyrivibrio sp. YE44]SDB24633.1 fructuronate reductase [Pseudobutyrivibrio sp. YE44]
MKLSNEGIKDRNLWEEKGYKLPEYDREKMVAATKEKPVWVHFGAGNIFRAFQANVVENLLNQGIMDRGLIVAEGYDYEIIEKYNRPCDDLSILATLKADGTVEKKVVGSIAESCILDEDNEKEMVRLREIFRNPSLQMVSFTITEKGYKTRAYMDKVVGLIFERFNAGAYPISIVSMDNCSHNGDKLKEAVVDIAKDWFHAGKCENDFVNYVTNPSVVAFPLSMIDKITPRPDDTVKEMLIADGVEGAEPIVTSKNTYVANFVNAEETEYLVIEDLFPNGRPELEKGGIIFTDRETVDKTEKMKVCTCLNPLHTALAIFGCLLGYNTIHDEMEDEDLKKLVTRLGKEEGMKVVVDPKVLSPDAFLDAVLTKRLPNPFMPDTPQRIACDTSQKLPIRFGETIKAYRSNSSLSTENLKIVPLVLAGYLRYLEGIDDNGKQFEQSPDPLLDELKQLPAKDVLKRQDVFGVDLYSDGLAKKVLAIHAEMKGVGNIRKELEAV